MRIGLAQGDHIKEEPLSMPLAHYIIINLYFTTKEVAQGKNNIVMKKKRPATCYSHRVRDVGKRKVNYGGRDVLLPS